MDVRQISYVLAVADEGGFTRAAETLRISQPALSEAIRRVERELGTPLFHRVGRGVTLTPAGETFVFQGRQVVRDFGNLRSAVDAIAGLRAGHLDLVALPTLAVDPVSELVGAFRLEHPNITVRIAEPEDDADAVAMIESGRSEIGLLELPVKSARLLSEVLLAQEIVAVCPPATRLPRGRLSINTLSTMWLVTTRIGTSSRRLVEDAFADEGLHPKIAVETEQREALIPLVLAGAGSALLPRVIADEGRSHRAVVARLRVPIQRRIGVVYRRGPSSPAGQAFIALARSHFPARRSPAPT